MTLTRRSTVLVFVIALLTGCASADSSRVPATRLQGVWRVVDVVTTGPSASANSQPQPGLYLFTAKHYSIMRVTARTPRPEVQDPTKATAAELLAVWGNQGFIANAGTYDVTGGDLTIRPFVAKNPGVMKPGSFTTFSYKIDGGMLSLTNTRNNDGPIANPTTLKLTRLE
jgi:hypothetical protein